MVKTISWYRKSQYGCDRDYVVSTQEADAKIIQQLTGQKTIDGRIRELIRDLSGGQIQFQQVLPQ